MSDYNAPSLIKSALIGFDCVGLLGKSEGKGHPYYNIERHAGGDYIIRVTHNGNLLNGFQDFSLIATGISEADFTYTPDNIRKESCSDQVAQYAFNYASSANYNGPTTLSATGLPAGAVATFAPSVITTDEDFILEISARLDYFFTLIK